MKTEMNSNPDDYEVEERAAIRQFDAGQNPTQALATAKLEIEKRIQNDLTKVQDTK